MLGYAPTTRKCLERVFHIYHGNVISRLTQPFSRAARRQGQISSISSSGHSPGSNSTPEMEFLQDFPPGPLDAYRKQASFNWKQMALIMEDESLLQYKFKIWKTLEDDPLFAHSPVPYPFQEERRLSTERVLKIFQYGFHNYPDFRFAGKLHITLGAYDWSMAIQLGLLQGFYVNLIRGQGTSKHYDFIDAAMELKALGCVCITEIAHGTNTKGLRTTATFDTKSQSFVLNTPDFEAAKCWAGNLGKTATHAVVLAQLYTPDGMCHGLHNFVVPIRDPQAMQTFAGIRIGDMGAKLGLNGIDNGFMMFDSYKIPRDNLLNKNGDVTPEGKYASPQKDPSKRFSASLGALSAGRAGIVGMAAMNLTNAVTISIRYSALRRQFGHEDGNELPVIEYQMQQWRLFPYLAASYVWTCFSSTFMEDFIQFVISQYNPDISKEDLGLLSGEIHAISSSAKPVIGWLARDGIQESREACGGHGYLRCSGFGRLRNDNDANCTYEGDNNVLLQQTSNWLLNNAVRSQASSERNSPLGALNFLANETNINENFGVSKIEELRNPTVLLNSYKWLVRWMLKSTSAKFQAQQALGKNGFTAKNDSQIYFARTLSIVFIEWFALERFWNKLCSANSSPEITNVLQKLFYMYGYWSLEKHLMYFYEGGYFEGSEPVNFIRQTILDLCVELKPEVVALVDAIAPTDFILNSALGKSDGNLYKNLEVAMSETPNCFERPAWWKDIVNRMEQRSKL